MQRILGGISGLGFGVAIVLLGRLTLDLGRLHAAIAICIGGFYLGFLLVVGSNVLELVRGEAPGPELRRGSRWSLAIAVPIALLGSVLDCMGLGFEGCTPTCAFLMHVVAPIVAAAFLLHAATGARVWVLLAVLAALALMVPNCVCRNPVNRGWIELLGQSPACYASSVAVILLAGTTLAARRRVRLALALAWGVVTAELAFWIGHHYFHVPW